MEKKASHYSMESVKNRKGNSNIPWIFEEDSLPSEIENSLYIKLKRLIKQKGLLDRQPFYYTTKIIFTLGLYFLSISLLFFVDNFWIQLLNAVFLAFAYTQIGFIGHDAGHRQISSKIAINNFIGYVFGNLLLGFSYGWYRGKHNLHHSHPNELEIDPDIGISIVAFSEEKARNKTGLLRSIVKYQAYYFFPLQVFVSVSLRLNSIIYLMQKKSNHLLLEAVLMSVHHAVYFGLLFTVFNFWNAILFILVHQSVFGVYMASVFAPNHKGMPVLEDGMQLDFLRQQVLTSRDVKAHRFTDFWYGALNYQIEHHLFPNMPRNKLTEAQHVVREFCFQNNISYYETSVIQSYKEILQYLHAVSAPLREQN